MFPMAAYLKRIGLQREPLANRNGLFELHRAQFFHIPFENFDIQLGHEIGLDPMHLFDKLINRQRGGYCFELNGLLLMALKELGFQARPLLARVHLNGSPGGRTHQLSEVTLGSQTWLVDVGFGAGGPRQPLQLGTEEETWVEGFGYRMRNISPWGAMLETYDDGIWKPSYSFDLGYAGPGDIAMGNFYTSHSPDTHFTQSRTASLPVPHGRISLRNFDLTYLRKGEKQVTRIQPGQAYLEALKTHFGIDLGADYSALKPLAEERGVSG